MSSLLCFLAGDDYISVNTTVTFGVGSVDGSPSCFDVTIDNNMAFEKSESFSLHIEAIEDNVEAHTKYFTIEIMDDDGECFVVSSAAFFFLSLHHSAIRYACVLKNNYGRLHLKPGSKNRGRKLLKV